MTPTSLAKVFSAHPTFTVSACCIMALAVAAAVIAAYAEAIDDAASAPEA